MRLGENIGSVFSKGRDIQKVYSYGKLVWERPPIDYSKKPFTVECVSNRCYIQVRGNGVIKFKYSISGKLYNDYRGIWFDADSSEEIELRGKGSKISIIAADLRGCYIRGECDVCGNILSLIYGDDYSKYVDTPYVLNSFFIRENSSTTGSDIRSARNLILPTVLSNNCFAYMFNYCTYLTEAPELPSTNLADYCYRGMFYGCSNLTTAPTLPATTLKYGCYDSMFHGCSQLTEAPELPATTLAERCYASMFQNCSQLTKTPELPSTNLANYCYSGMFYDCSNLTTAPTLPATTLKYHCYESMFNGCSNLTTAPTLPASILVGGCYESMFAYCWDLDYVKCYAISTINDATTVYSCVKNWLVNAGSHTDKRGRLECYYNIASQLSENTPNDWDTYSIKD